MNRNPQTRIFAGLMVCLLAILFGGIATRPISTALASGVQLPAYGTVQNGGVSVTQRNILNFVSGGCVDNVGTKATDCTIGGSGIPFGPTIVPAPAVGSLTWINQGTATAANPHNLLLLQDTGNNGNLRMLAATAANANFTFTAQILPTLPNVANTRVGICMRESGTGKIQDFMLIGGGGTSGNGPVHVIDRWDNATTFGAQIQTAIYVNSTYTFGSWIRMQYDGTNVISFVSGDGEYWYQIGSSLATVSFTVAPNQYGACISPSNGAGVGVAESIITWVES